MSIRSALLIAALLAPASALAESARDMAREGIEAYGDAEYEFALSRLREAEAASDFARLSDEERVLLHKYIGYCEIAFDRPLEAKAAFRAALAIDPALELDADRISPKILAVFREAKRESSAALAAEPDPSPTPIAVATPTPVARPHSSAAMLVPGLPQLKHGETGKGLALFGTGAASVGMLVALQWSATRAEFHLRNADPVERPELRKQANEIRTLRNAAFVPIVLVWGVSAWDAGRARPAAAVVISGDGASVTMAWSL